MDLFAVRELDIGFLPIGVVREIRAKEDRHPTDLDLTAEVDLILKILAKSAAPRMVGVWTVTRVLYHSVDRVALEEAGVLSRDEVSDGVRIIFRNIVPVVRVERDLALAIDLGLGELSADNAMRVTRKSLGRVAGLSLVAERDLKLEYSVGNVDYRLGKSLVELQLNELAIGELDSEFVALLVLAEEALVDLVAVRLELDVSVLS